jgi:hypothetical protein
MRDVDAFAALMGSATRAHTAATPAEAEEHLDRARLLARQLLQTAQPEDLVVAVARAGTAIVARALSEIGVDPGEFSFNTEAAIFLDPEDPPA